MYVADITILGMKEITPLKTNVEPENTTKRKRRNIYVHHQFLDFNMWIFQGVVENQLQTYSSTWRIISVGCKDRDRITPIYIPPWSGGKAIWVGRVPQAQEKGHRNDHHVLNGMILHFHQV